MHPMNSEHVKKANHFDNRAKGKQVLRLVNRLQNLGFAVQITPMAAQVRTCFFLGVSRGDISLLLGRVPQESSRATRDGLKRYSDAALGLAKRQVARNIR